jgi:cystathionine beta-lyase
VDQDGRVDNPLASFTLDQLRARRSLKWRAYDPDVLPVWIAEMDTPLAEPIADALRQAIATGDTGYAHPGGLPSAFSAFSEWAWGWSPDPALMVVVPDVVTGLAEVIKVTTEPGDGIAVNTPVYPPFFSVVRDSGRRIVESPLALGAGGRYQLDLEALGRDLARPDVTAYMLCNPHNPSGLVLSNDEVRAVAALAARYGVRVISDEVHAPLIYPGRQHTPFGTVPGAGPGIVVTSASKAWNLAGLKASLIIACGAEGWLAVNRIPATPTFGTALFGVVAGEAAYRAGVTWLSALLAGLDHNRRLLAELLAEHLPTVGYTPPESTFLAWLDLRPLGLGDDPAAVLLERGRVALANGPNFGDLGRGFARLNFGTSPELLTEAVRRMATAVDDFSRRS